MHIKSEPAVLYFGTPVVLVSTRNEDGTTNVAPMSSCWWLGWSAMLGLQNIGKTAENLRREKECVLNLPSMEMAEAVNKMARLTGSNPVPDPKLAMGYRHEKDKLNVAGLTGISSELVGPQRVMECPVQLEAVLVDSRPFGAVDYTRPLSDHPKPGPLADACEVRIVRAHLDDSILLPGQPNRVDDEKWHALIMCFSQLHGVGNRLRPSTLAEIPEELYRPFATMTANDAHRKTR